MNVQSVEQPEEDAQAKLQEHPQAHIIYRLRFVDLENLGDKAEHGQDGRTRADQFP
jgi:hypothetical protein